MGDRMMGEESETDRANPRPDKLRVLTLSSLYPDRTRPTFGVFVERQTLGLAARPDVEVRVAAPIAVPPTALLKLHPHYRDLSSQPRVEQYKGLTVYRHPFRTLPFIGKRWNPLSIAWALIPLLDDVYREFPFDVIDAEFFYPDGPAAMRIARHFNVPFSIKARGGDIHFWTDNPACKRAIQAAGKAADGLLAVSEEMRNDMIALGMPAERIKVHHTGVDQAAFHPMDRAAAKAALGINGPLILTVGYLIARKGQTLVIDAMLEIPDATLLIVGQGPDKAALEDQIRARGLQDRVRLIGPKAHEDLPPLFAAADVMALPSASEGLANVWVEATACGTPIVIADIGGAREVVESPSAGRIVERTPAAIAAAINELLANPPAQAEVAKAAAKFTWARNTETLYAHLRSIVDAFPGKQ
jgi:glycosyltransferase involved in cell wall biosynthesis